MGVQQHALGGWHTLLQTYLAEWDTPTLSLGDAQTHLLCRHALDTTRPEKVRDT